MSSPSQSKIIGWTFVGVAAAALSYCVYFDYERRHNPEKEKLKRRLRCKLKRRKTKLFEVLKKKLNESLAASPLPTTLQEKEPYFLEQVSTGEKLGAIPGKEIDAAIYFYKGLAVYPNPTGILDIYQRTLPPQIYELVMKLTAIQPPKSVVNILGDSVGSLDAEKTVE
ncbi:hypothetical protein HII13_002631 [Brettanomyces bruxellensis]|nr:hypothetical protein HII13_002631 [Brettanomyces bruxellensis]